MYLIDGYNLLYQTTLETREELIEKINDFCRHQKKQAIIIFDGYSPEDLSNNYVEVRFVGDADQEILSLIKNNNNPTSLTLVSSDKDLGFVARQNKIKVLKAEHFNYIIPSVASDPEKNSYIIMSDSEAKKQLEEYNYFKNKNI